MSGALLREETVTETRAWVVRTKQKPGVWEAIQNGRARMGWSYADRLDLRKLARKKDRGESLDEKEQGAWGCKGFLKYVDEGDYLVYPKQPDSDSFVVVRVTGPYDYAAKSEALGDEDFRSYRRCEVVTETPVDYHDEIVPPIVRSKLGLQGRFYELKDWEEFQEFLDSLDQQGTLETDDSDVRLRRIAGELRRSLPELLQSQYPQHDLSRRFCMRLFEEGMDYSVDLQEGPGEEGSDLIVNVGSPLLPDTATSQVGVQVGSYSGSVSAEKVKEKLDQLTSGWEQNELDYGALLTTGECTEEAHSVVREHNEDHPEQPVKLIDGEEVARLFLHHLAPELASLA